MKKKDLQRCLAGIVVSAFFIISHPFQSYGLFYPDDGDLYHNGAFYADSYMKWSSPGPWEVDDPGYEHDLILEETFYDSCTAWTNLPDDYDDCLTAGIQDAPGFTAFSFGTYDAKKIVAKKWYWGYWCFSGGEGTASSVKLSGQKMSTISVPLTALCV